MRHILVSMLLMIVLSMVGCGNSNGTADTAQIAATTPTATNNTVEKETPTQVTKHFLEAVRRQEYSQVRELLSQRSLDNLTTAANNSKTNLDQALKRIVDQDAQDMRDNKVVNFELRNEEIKDDHARVEAKATNAPEYARLSLTYEATHWKINIDETSPAPQ